MTRRGQAAGVDAQVQRPRGAGGGERGGLVLRALDLGVGRVERASTSATLTQTLPPSPWSTVPRTSTIESVLQDRLAGQDDLLEDEQLDLAVEVVERREHHGRARARLDLLAGGDHPADLHPLAVAPLGHLGAERVGLRPAARRARA